VRIVCEKEVKRKSDRKRIKENKKR
jgi:hypothetical protein